MKIKNGTLLNGDVFEMINNVEDKSVQSIITSPPYWALRDYGNDSQIGLENTFQEYLDKLVDVFNNCKRILKDEGLLFINIADTYTGTGSKKDYKDPIYLNGRNGQKDAKNNKVKGIKRKSLIGIPQRLQIAMIDRGWICRNVIIWRKPNAMPSSVKDRFSNDFEYIFMFSKNPVYKFNQLKEPMISKDLTSPRGSKGVLGSQNSGNRKVKSNKEEYSRNKRAVWDVNTQASKDLHFAAFPEKLITDLVLCSTDKNDVVLDPFMGSGTVAKIAEENERSWIGIEINKEYCEIIQKRVSIIKQKLF